MIFNSSTDIEKYFGCHQVVASILFDRGFCDSDSLDAFIKPELGKLPEANSLYDMERAADRSADAVVSGQRVTVYGDYDVDGTCGTALLLDFFKQLKGVVTVNSYQPDRFKEGYGVHSEAIEKICDDGKQLIITVDCGITAAGPARVAASRGVDMIILDHHACGAEFPTQAYAVVNPQRTADNSGLKNLCGTGIAFFFCVALRAELRRRRYFEGGIPEPNLKQLLDLVAVATVADMMDVRGVNRILLTHGLHVLKKSPRPGLKAILDSAGISNPTAAHCGFILGPRINAAGRLQHASAALKLLMMKDPAENSINELEVINNERKVLQGIVVEEALVQAREQIKNPIWNEIAKTNPVCSAGPWPRALVLYDPDWHEGVLGIAASRVVEEFDRPVFILSKAATAEALKGSARSMSGIDILAAITADSVRENLLNYGGHAHAAGVTLLESRFNEFLTAINMHLALTTTAEQYVRKQRQDAQVSLEEITPRLLQELEALGPFGIGFSEPILKVMGAVSKDVKILKDKHLKFALLNSNIRMDAIWFNGASNIEKLRKSKDADFWVKAEWNEWRGNKHIQLKVMAS